MALFLGFDTPIHLRTKATLQKAELLNKSWYLFNSVLNFPMLGVDLVPQHSTKYGSKYHGTEDTHQGTLVNELAKFNFC
jgi:hypothetical protein